MSRLDELKKSVGEQSATLADDYQRIEPVLAYFADDMIMASTLPFATKWTDSMLLASEARIGGVADGRARFFLELDATLREVVKAKAAPRLAIYQTCLGLGFGGVHRDNPARLREYSDQILQQLDIRTGNRRVEDRVCGEAYEHTQTDQLCNPIAEKIWAIGIICGALVLAALIAYFWICFDAKNQITDVLGAINKTN